MANRTDCRSPEAWQALLSRTIPPAEADALANHLEECESCADAIDAGTGDHVLDAALHSQANARPAPVNAVVQSLIGQFRDLKAVADTDTTATITPVEGDHLPAPALPIFGPPHGPGELGWVAHYRVLKRLGEGGMGLVFLAEDSLLQRQVALKVMQPQLAASAVHRERFVREARAAAALEHDHIVPIYQVGEEKGVPFLAMKLLKGESLDDYLQSGKAIAPAQAARIGLETALGLAAAHAKGLIHRDVKPANIWLEAPRGRVKLLDFGLARADRDESHLTSQNVIVGTPAYMAPEQARCEMIDGRTDLFSLGVVLYRLLAGRAPFQGNDAVSTLLLVTTQTPKPVPFFNPMVPPALAGLVMRLLEKNPTRRPASAAETARLLADILKSQAIVAAPVGILPPGPAPVTPASEDTDAGSIRMPRRRAKDSKRGMSLWAGLGVAAVAMATAILIIRIKTPDGKERTIEVPDGSKIAIEASGKAKPGKPVDDAWINEVAALPPQKQFEAVDAKLRQLNPGFGEKIDYKIEDGAVTFLAFSTEAVRDISPVRALRGLRRLRCQPPGADVGKWTGQLKDLTALRGMDLVDVGVGGNPGIRDLSPLTGMKLTAIGIHGTAVSDLSPLRDMPLISFICSHSKVSDLSPLAGARISGFYADDVAISDLTPLKGMPLWTVQISKTAVRDPSLLNNTPVQHLSFDYSPWRDAELIRKPSLKTINFKPADEFRKEAAARLAAFESWCHSLAKLPPEKQVEAVAAKLKERNPDFSGRIGNRENGEIEFTVKDGSVNELVIPTDSVVDLSPVRALSGLKSLICQPTGGWERETGMLADLWPLRGLALVQLKVDGNRSVSDLTPLRAMKLDALYISGTGVRNLEALRGIPLKHLGITKTSIRDLSPLVGKNLQTLYLGSSEVTDLSPLKGMPLTHLEMTETAAYDLSILLELPLLDRIKVNYNPRRDAALIRKPSLKTINGKSAAEFRKEVAGK